MPDPSTYNVGWICAIKTEFVAAQAFLDEKHDRSDHVNTNDSNIYTLGRLGKHNVVIGAPPDGEYGIATAVGVAKGMLSSFPNIRIGLMVGIGGGAPNSKNDIRLGDIVVSAPQNGHGGVFQYDFGKTVQDNKFQTVGFLNRPLEVLRAALTDIQAKYEMERHQLEEAIDMALNQKPRLRKNYQRPSNSSDRLFKSGLVHREIDGTDCVADCYDGPSSLVERRDRTSEEDNPAIHYGTIASANHLMKDAYARDRLAAEENVLCFEMEAAGLMKHFPCLVIRGICDYSDSHKNKEWQGYAAMAAAAYAKDLLERISPNKLKEEKKLSKLLENTPAASLSLDTKAATQDIWMYSDFENVAKWLSAPDSLTNLSKVRELHQPGIGQWLLDSDKYHALQVAPIEGRNDIVQQLLHGSTGIGTQGCSYPISLQTSTHFDKFTKRLSPPHYPPGRSKTQELRMLIDGLYASINKSYSTQSHKVELPHIVVVGDQSAGKRSLLEALSGLPFPGDAGLSTRYATTVLRLPRAKEFRPELFNMPEMILQTTDRAMTLNGRITSSSAIENNIGASSAEEKLGRDDTGEPHVLYTGGGLIKHPVPHERLQAKSHLYKHLTCREPNIMLEIGEQVRKQLAADGLPLKSGSPPQRVKMSLNVMWNPVLSMREAGLKPPYKEALSKLVCLTGTWSEAQATTVEDYMEQTWPGCGHFLISLLQTLVSIPEGQVCSYEVYDSMLSKRGIRGRAAQPSNTPSLTAFVKSPSWSCISVTGDAYFVSEIVEQLAWLGSALQHSWDNHTPVACTPCIRNLQVATQTLGSDPKIALATCNLSFMLEMAETSEMSPGFCWGQLVCNPVLVRGYPILRRPQPDTGLEMSLASMAAIIGSFQAIQWGERIMIKGYHMLAVTALTEMDTIVWHLFVSEQPGERISYIDPRVRKINSESLAGLSLRALEEKRHIIGWCSNVSDLCGDGAANLDIGGSGLPEPPASTVIDNLYLKAGTNFIAGGFEMRFNQKEKPFWLVRDQDYPSLIKWIGIQPIVFCDVGDHRAWLTDGASALLHLLRASLHSDENDPDSVYDWVFDRTRFNDKWPGLTARQAALKTLTSWENLNLNVYVASKQSDGAGGFKIKYSTLRQRVEKILHSIEILIDKQAEHNAQSGIRIPQGWDARDALLGFDIRDIIESYGIARVRIDSRGSWGHGWVDLIRAMGATSIFGQGFSDLLIPKEPHTMCSGWRSVPTGEGYMAASVSTLQLLYERCLLKTQPDLGPGKLTNKIIWASPRHPFQPCGCLTGIAGNSGDSSHCHDDSVQFLLAEPSWRLRNDPHKWTPVEVMRLEKEGAVIFANISFFRRRKKGNSIAERQHRDADAISGPEQITREWITPPFARSTASGLASLEQSIGTASLSLDASRSTSTGDEEQLAVNESKKSDKKLNFFARFKNVAR